MEYKKIGETFYVRMDRGDEIVSNLLEICRKESIPSAIFSRNNKKILVLAGKSAPKIIREDKLCEMIKM